MALRRGDFNSLGDALDYAAQGETGANFHVRGKLATVLPYRVLREQALTLARRLRSLPLEPGARVALVAETSPDFLRFFFACQYAGLVPVALPSVVNLGGHDAYVRKLQRMLHACGASAAMGSESFQAFLAEASAGLGLVHWGTPASFDALPEADVPPWRARAEDIAYLQYTSGSTGFPRSAVISQQAVMANLYGALNSGIYVCDDDRFVSWLPFYHDMGLVGCMLCVIASQRSVDYLDTREFAMRPRRWLDLLSSSHGTISYSPPFGYELCALRVHPSDVAGYDLSHWRVAGIGAEPISPDVPRRFAELLAPTGFDPRAFVPSYGMAESSLAISFSPLRHGVVVDWIDPVELAENLYAKPVATGGGRGFVRCGGPLPGHAMEVVDAVGRPLPERRVGRIRVRGPSVMEGYLGLPGPTRVILAEDGWLDTGDIGYLVDGEIVVTGRRKDMIILNGRNIWPQDIERIVERQPELRPLDASAFGLTRPDGSETAVVVVQCNLTAPPAREELVQRLRREIYASLGIHCLIELVPRHTLPRTSSGKLSRSATRTGYLERHPQVRTDGIQAAGIEIPSHRERAPVAARR